MEDEKDALEELFDATCDLAKMLAEDEGDEGEIPVEVVVGDESLSGSIDV